MRRRSSSGSFEVQCRSTAIASSVSSMPMPSSLTTTRLWPPSFKVTSMRVAPASIEFSTNSLSAEAGRSITSPAAMRLTTVSGRRRRTMRLLCRFAPHLAKVLPRDDLAFFDRGLIKGIHAKEIGGDDGLEHEMHEEPAEHALVESREVEAPSRPAAADEALLGGALLGIEKIAHAPADEIAERGIGGEIGRDRLAHAGDLGRHKREHLVGRAREIK